MSGIDQSKEITQADAAWIVQQSQPDVASQAMAKLNFQVQEMSARVAALPSAQRRALLGTAKLRSTSSRALLTLARDLDKHWASGAPGSVKSRLPKLDPSFNDLAHWLQAAKADPDKQFMPQCISLLQYLAKEYDGIAARIQGPLPQRPGRGKAR